MGSKLCAKSSVKSVRSVREKTPQRISSVLSHMEGAFSFSQKNTDEQNTQRSERQRPLPLPQPFTPPCPAVQAYKALLRSPLPLPATSLLCREKSLHITKLTTSRQVNIIIYNQAYNPQEISELHLAFEYMPSLLAEDALHGTRKPCSRTLKALFLHQARPLFEKRGEWLAKYPYIFYLHSQFPVSHKRHFLLSQTTIFSLTDLHRKTEQTNFHRDIKSTDFTEPYSHLWQ